MRRCKPRPEAQERPARQPAKAEAPIVFVDDDDEAMRERSQACFDRSVSRSRQTDKASTCGTHQGQRDSIT
jgi:hypothetical protein